MVAKIKYSDIETKLLYEVVKKIDAIKKGTLKDVLAKDIIHQSFLNKPINELNYNDIYSWGIYIFFDANDCIRYIGKSKNGFYGRLMSQMTTAHKKYWGWNALLRKMGGERTGLSHDDLSDKEHEKDFKTLLKYKLLLIEVEEGELNEKELGWLEKYLMKAYKNSINQKLLNTRVGCLTETEKHQTIKELIK